MRPSAIVLASAVAAMPALAAELMESVDAGHTAAEKLVLPGTEYALEPGTLRNGPRSSLGELQRAIATWLALEFGLPSIEEMPVVSFASKRSMLALRYSDVPSDLWFGNPRPPVEAADDIVAIYDSRTKTIYLPEDWSGDTPAELSILVHELVHHIQNLSGLRFACSEAREEMAFAAQERWLQLFGRSLLAEFDLDPLTLLVRTKCL